MLTSSAIRIPLFSRHLLGTNNLQLLILRWIKKAYQYRLVTTCNQHVRHEGSSTGGFGKLVPHLLLVMTRWLLNMDFVRCSTKWLSGHLRKMGVWGFKIPGTRIDVDCWDCGSFGLSAYLKRFLNGKRLSWVQEAGMNRSFEALLTNIHQKTCCWSLMSDIGMQHLRRSIASTKLRTGGLSSGVARSGSVGDGVSRSGCFKGINGGSVLAEDKLGAAGFRTAQHSYNVNEIFRQYRSLCLLSRMNGSVTRRSFSRSYAARSTRKGETSSEAKKDISKVEDPFDAPTYNIPEKPVTFVEGASYSVVILVGLGVAAAAAYAVFNELIFQPKEYKIFNTALKRIQDDSQVRIRIGSPITGYGQESRNRAARQRIPHRFWTDEEGVEHIEVNFYIRGPHGAGKVYCQMFKDKMNKQWKFTSLIVQILSPSPAQLLLESYVPA